MDEKKTIGIEKDTTLSEDELAIAAGGAQANNCLLCPYCAVFSGTAYQINHHIKKVHPGKNTL